MPKLTQMQMFELARRQIAETDSTFMELVNHPTNPITREDLAACIERRPQLWSRYAGFVDVLPSRLAVAFKRQPYVGGNPTAAEFTAWAFRYWRAVVRTKSGTPGFPASEAIRLARQDAVMGKTRYPSSARDYGYGPAFKMRGAKAMRWIEKPSTCGLRFVGYAGKLARLNHSGWFIDNDQNETVQGVVFQLPGRNGKPLFVAGYDNPWNGKADSNGPVCLDFADIFEGDATESDNPANVAAAIDAAGYADQLAEWMAEDEREYRAASSAGQRFAELGDEIKADRKLALELLAERRAARGDGKAFPAICATIRQRVSEILHGIADARAKRAKLIEGEFVGDWLPGWNTSDKRLVDAFNESAGIHA